MYFTISINNTLLWIIAHTCCTHVMPATTCEITGGMNAQTNAETAALIVVANAMLNLDEVITKN